MGSIKYPIIKIWEKIHPFFIGSHPMAGTEKKGVDSGYEGLLKNAKWIITPTQESNLNAVNTLTKLITSMDCKVYTASPREHDEATSLISHLPIFLASALIKAAYRNSNQSLTDLTQTLAASGFADTTRVGGGNPQLGLDLARYNQNNVLKAIEKFKNKIHELESLIKDENWEVLSKKLEETKEVRKNFIG